MFLIFLVVIVGAYFLFIAPQRRKMRAQMNQGSTFQVGDEVVTKSGIYGSVRSMDGDRVRLEIAHGTTIEVMKTSIARRVEPVVAEAEDEEDEEDVETDGDLPWESPEADAHVAAPEPAAPWGANGAPVGGGDEPRSSGTS